MVIISIEKASWVGIGIAHIFIPNMARAVSSHNIDSKADLDNLKKQYPGAKIHWQ